MPFQHFTAGYDKLDFPKLVFISGRFISFRIARSAVALNLNMSENRSYNLLFITKRIKYNLVMWFHLVVWRLGASQILGERSVVLSRSTLLTILISITSNSSSFAALITPIRLPLPHIFLRSSSVCKSQISFSSNHRPRNLNVVTNSIASLPSIIECSGGTPSRVGWKIIDLVFDVLIVGPLRADNSTMLLKPPCSAVWTSRGVRIGTIVQSRI